MSIDAASLVKGFVETATKGQAVSTFMVEALTRRGETLYNKIVEKDAEYLNEWLVAGSENRASWEMFCSVAGNDYSKIKLSPTKRLEAVSRWCGDNWAKFEVARAEEKRKGDEMREAFRVKDAEKKLEAMRYADPKGDLLVNGTRCMSGLSWLKKVITDGYTEPVVAKRGSVKCLFLCLPGNGDTKQAFPFKEKEFWLVAGKLLGKKIE